MVMKALKCSLLAPMYRPLRDDPSQEDWNLKYIILVTGKGRMTLLMKCDGQQRINLATPNSM
jgi:hypothetical protein